MKTKADLRIAAHTAAANSLEVTGLREVNRRADQEFEKLAIDAKHFEEFHRQFDAERNSLLALNQHPLEVSEKTA